MTLENKEGPIKVVAKEKASPIRVVLKNADISQRKLSLEYPGQVKYWRAKLKKSGGTLVVAFDLLDAIEEPMQLEVRLRYGGPPASSEYDLRLKIQWNNQLEHSKDTQILSSLGKDTPNIQCRIIDDKSFICQNSKNIIGDTVWFSARYEGPMPPKNVLTDKLPWNFTSSIHEPECLFWNESKNMFDGRGVEVGHRIMMSFIC